MRYCDHCEIEFTNPTCPRCGARPASRHQQRSEAREELPRHSTFVSEVPDTMDHMVEEASRPTLASLIKRGLDKGLIQPIHDYASKIGK